MQELYREIENEIEEVEYVIEEIENEIERIESGGSTGQATSLISRCADMLLKLTQ